jgi:hypothetical protein
MKKVVSMPVARLDLSTFTVWSVAGVCAFLVGCRHARAPGGDSPVTTQRLTGTRLTDIREDLSWTFSDTVVVIENKDQPIPADLVQELLGNRSTPTRIEGTWQLDEQAGVLHLSDVKADGENIDTELAIPIKPAGHVRVDLGSRQYNLLRSRPKER